MASVPIAPNVLVWAREYRGLTKENAAERLRITVEYLEELEAGHEVPSLTLFRNIGSRYRIPLSTLFRRTEPKVPGQPQDFRTVGGGSVGSSFELSVAISKARALLGEVEAIAQTDEEFLPPHLPMYEPTRRNAERVGTEERNRIGPSYQDQITTAGANEKFAVFRNSIERQGVYVFLLKMPLENCRGFALVDDDRFPCIVINKFEESRSARTFTLVHEYMHIVSRSPGVSGKRVRGPIERFCNRAAASFLMPQEVLRGFVGGTPNEPRSFADVEIARWARKLGISKHALAIRLEELRWAPERFSRKYAVGPHASIRKPSSGGNYVNTRLNELGSGYTRTVISAFDRGSISKAAAAEGLGLSPEHFPVARKRVFSS